MISVVVPVLNEEKLLPDCLRSLRDQDYAGEYEVIVADNDSTDGSVGVARQFGVRVVLSPVKRDVASARDCGARAARGEIIVQADADTVYPRDWLTRVDRILAQHPEAVALAGNFVYKESVRYGRAEFYLRHVINFLTIRLFRRPFLVSGANFAFRKEAFLRVNGYDRTRYAPDQFGIASQLVKLGKIIYDRKLSVATSTRRARKPLILQLSAMFMHTSRFCVYLLKPYAPSLPVTATKLAPSRKTLAMVLPALLAVSVIAYGYFIPTSPVFGKVYYEANTRDKVVALTFDDGPNDPYTSKILDILDANGIKATFFVTGNNVELYPDTARRMVAEGHILGNHSYQHQANHALSTEGYKDALVAENAIFNTVGVRPHLYRPPHGKKSPWELQMLKRQNLIEVTWSVSTNELRVKSPELIASRIVKETKAGEIILLHDGFGNYHNRPEADKSRTVAALPLIIKALQDRGYRFVTVPELLGVPAYH